MSDDERDFYAILGLKKNATDDQIKKAYKTLAVKYHPDKQVGKSEADVKKAEEMFKKISEAYHILSDADQRRKYDQYGADGLKNGPMPQGAQFSDNDAFNIFNQFFGNSSGFGAFGPFGQGSFTFSTKTSGKSRGMSSGISNDEFEDMSTFGAPPHQMRFKKSRSNNPQYPRRKVVGEDRTLEYQIDLADFYNGVTKKLKVDYSVGNERLSEIVEIEIQKGWRSGVKITFNGKSSCKENEIPGDLIVELVEKPINSDQQNSYFVRRINVSPQLYTDSPKPDSEKYADLVYILQINLKEAQKGCRKNIKHMDGRTITIQVPPLTRSSQEIVCEDEGMPIRKNGEIVGNGDLYIRFDIMIK